MFSAVNGSAVGVFDVVLNLADIALGTTFSKLCVMRKVTYSIRPCSYAKCCEQLLKVGGLFFIGRLSSVLPHSPWKISSHCSEVILRRVFGKGS